MLPEFGPGLAGQSSRGLSCCCKASSQRLVSAKRCDRRGSGTLSDKGVSGCQLRVAAGDADSNSPSRLSLLSARVGIPFIRHGAVGYEAVAKPTADGLQDVHGALDAPPFPVEGVSVDPRSPGRLRSWRGWRRHSPGPGSGRGWALQKSLALLEIPRGALARPRERS